jgi:hypothetical protein
MQAVYRQVGRYLCKQYHRKAGHIRRGPCRLYTARVYRQVGD